MKANLFASQDAHHGGEGVYFIIYSHTRFSSRDARVGAGFFFAVFLGASAAGLRTKVPTPPAFAKIHTSLV